jgi:hypothetical protein
MLYGWVRIFAVDSFGLLQFNYDQSVYGFREYFKKNGFSYSKTK